jgi:sec-independent protein translocase protein TatC
MAKHTRDDLFEGTTMTFGEHLEELRSSLFRSIVGIAIGCAIGFYFANAVVNFFQKPLEKAMEKYYIGKAIGDLETAETFGASLPPEVKRMILVDHLIPEAIQMETGRLLDTLKATYPEQFAGMHVSAYVFVPADLSPNSWSDSQASTLAAELVAEGKATAPTPGKRVWELLSADERKTLETLGKSQEALTDAQDLQLLAVLNHLVGKRELHESSEFKNVGGVDAATIDQLRESLAKKFNAEDSRRLNKFLLTAAYSDYLRAPRLNLIPLPTWKPVKVRFQVLNAQEAFLIWMKAGLVTGLMIASPWVFYQIWLFVAAGLYPHEKNYVYLYMPISILLFFGGASLAYVFVFDPVLNFLFTFNRGMNADFDPRIGEWLSFVLIMPIGFGLSFQLPLVMLFVNRIGLISINYYLQQWRIAILTICVIAMVLTPADPISMMLMAVPLCFLYLVGILMCKFMPRGRNPFDEAYEP